MDNFNLTDTSTLFTVKIHNKTKNKEEVVKNYFEMPKSMKIIDVSIWQKVKVEIEFENGLIEKFWTPIELNVHSDIIELSVEKING